MKRFTLMILMAAMGMGSIAFGEDWVMWGGTPDRRMNSKEKNPITDWQVEVKEEKDGKEVVVEKAKNIKWVAQLGSQSYGNPVVTNGLVIVGTNNEAKYDKSVKADASCLLIFEEKTGKFLYQRLSPKLAAGRVNDWPFQGVCATACVEGDLLWYATPRCEVVCLDLSPLKSGGMPREVWIYDMMKEQGVFPHNMTSCSTAVWGDYIYMITGNGVDETHKNIPAPRAPSVICFEKKTGKVIWTDNAPGARILHGEWASFAIGQANGKTLIICPLGDGWVYAYEAKSGKIVWKFDTNKKETVYPTTRNELIATPVIVGNYCYIANGQDPEHGEGPGHIWCIDITKEGDVSLELPVEEAAPKPGEELIGPAGAMGSKKGKANPNSAVVWHFDKLPNVAKAKPRERINRTVSTVVVENGLVFAPDFSGYLHCFDAKTGQRHWVYDMEAAMWGSPLVVDGKLYLCDEDGDVAIIPAKKEVDFEKDVITHNMQSASYCSPVYANGTLYIMTREKLFAIGK